MSFRIASDAVTAVLLGATWHKVTIGSFTIDAFDYVETAATKGGRRVGDVGFMFTSAEGLGSICGPLSAIQAVAVKP